MSVIILCQLLKRMQVGLDLTEDCVNSTRIFPFVALIILNPRESKEKVSNSSSRPSSSINTNPPFGLNKENEYPCSLDSVSKIQLKFTSSLA